ncbi:hypothetical protein [Enterococcus phage vB_Efs25_KEN11]|uniref:Uncharacterized protein n=1 Tax=Enterococcus phage vB_Efs6_KEN16 TaxID=3138325 RepID=A0AAX4PSJ6_9CAUD
MSTIFLTNYFLHIIIYDGRRVRKRKEPIILN